MFSYVSPEALVPPDHPLRAVRLLVNAALERLSGDFDALYAPGGRDSIAPEKLLRALLLQAFYSVRSERRLMEQVTCNMLFRWFVGLSMDAPVWDVTVFTKNRDRLLRGEVAGKFFAAVLADPPAKPLLSSEHFSVDTPHVAHHTNGRRSAIDGRTTRHLGYAGSQRIRKRIEEVFGWGKEIGGMRRTPLRGRERVGWRFTLRVAAYNLIRIPKLLAAPACSPKDRGQET
jgi:transposase